MIARPSIVVCVLMVAAALPGRAAAQGDGPRMYWKTLSGSNALTFMPEHTAANFNPADPAQVRTPNSDFEANIALLGYSRTLDLFGNAAIATIMAPVGNIKADISGLAVDQSDSASGFGDPSLQLDLNLIGAPAMNDLASLQRFEPKFTLDVLASLTLPVGEYNSGETLNLGQNRWYGRIGVPMMLTLGPWVPGERTTIELLPAVWIFGDNSDYKGGTLSTDPLFQLEGHITRDFTKSLWGSFDVAWFTEGKSKVNGVSGKSVNNLGVGLTLGYQVNDNILVTLGYFSTINDSGAGDLRGDQFRLNVTFGWNSLIEGMKRLSEEH